MAIEAWPIMNCYGGWDALDVKLTKTILDTDNSKVVVNKEYVDNRDQILQEQHY